MNDIHTEILNRQIEVFGRKHAPEFKQRVITLLANRGNERDWFALLADLLTTPLRNDLEQYARDLRKAGFEISSQELAVITTETIHEVLSQTGDVWQNYKSAKDPDNLTAAGAWSLGALARNADRLLSSILSTLRERFENKAFIRQTIVNIGQDLGFSGMTGRRLFLAGDREGGRHSVIHGQIVEFTEAFQLPARPEHGLPANRFFQPKEVMNTPGARREWSNSTSRVLYGYWDEGLGQEIFLGPRGGRYSSDGTLLRTRTRAPKNPFGPDSPVTPF